MEQDQFLALMPYISADLVDMLIRRRGITEEEALEKLYRSQLYAALEKEETKVWHYSTPMLYSLLEQEEKTGELLFPDV